MSGSLHDMPALGTFGRFDILGRLALGGMAEIFLAREGGRGASRLLVIKRVLPHIASDARFVEMFLHEAKVAMHISHPNVCAIYEFGEQEGTCFIAMEWVNGVSLKQIAKRTSGAGLPPPMAVRIAAEVADALYTANQARDQHGRPLNLVHRDVTPENIMISYDGAVKLLDFGIAKASTQMTRTQAGALKGKFPYMAPEQYRGENVDGRADVFSLGVCLYEVLTGSLLYHRATEYETMGAIVLDSNVPSVRSARPEITQALDALTQRALAKDVQQRFRSAGEMHQALERYLVDSGTVVRSVHISRYVNELFMAERDRGPKLDRNVDLGKPATKQSTDTTGIQPLSAGQLASIAAELDEEAAALERGRKRRQIIVAVAFIGVVLAVLGMLAYGLRTSAAPPQEAPAAAGP